MTSQKFFLGRPRYWALAVFVGGILATLGLNKTHVREFVTFQFTVLGLAIFVVAFIVYSYQPGEQIIREPLDKPDEE